MKKLMMGAAVVLACACGMGMKVHAEPMTSEKNTTAQSPYTVIGNDENGIPDAALYQWLLSNADYDYSGDLTISDLEQLSDMVITDTTRMRSLEGIQYCKNLTRVYLDGQSHCENPITDFSPLAGLTKLETLELAYANITDISFLTDLTNLTHLSLSGNQITDITPLAGMTEMETLWLDYNEISDISALADMTKLETLGLYENRIISTAPLTKATEMYYLDLAKNLITDLSGLSGMTKLDELDLTNNKITDISALAGLKQLRNLLLGGNQISNVSALNGFTELETLRLDDNQITDISSLKKSTEIIYLFLGGNQISDVNALQFMPKMQHLEIRDNQISNIRYLTVMKDLMNLDASGNQISDLGPLSVLENVAELNLDNNQIADVSPLSGYQALNLLWLSHNQIVDPSPLDNLSAIRDLYLVDLSYNQISDVSGISGLRAKGVVNLYGNPYELPRSELKTMYEDFVGRRYYALVDEWIPEEECDYWVNALLDKQIGAVQLVEALLNSEAFQSRHLSDEEYICAMYMCITDYWPETEEVNEWLAAFAAGTDRQALVDALLESDRFFTLCKDYYVEPSLESEERKAVKAFVTRMYTVVLGRKAETAGVYSWTKLLMDGTLDGEDIANGFVNSDEFVARNLNDSDYISVLYRAFLNREADEGGIRSWLEVMNNGTDRQTVLNGFIHSTEFADLCEEAGISASFTAEDMVRNFVKRMYTVVLNRSADKSGLESWTKMLINKEADGATIANGFVNSDEFVARGLSDEEYINVMYATFLNRTADESGINTWIGEFEKGATRQDVLNGFVNSTEFDNICDNAGIVAVFHVEDKVRSFVERMYTVALNRTADVAGVEDWTRALLNQEVNGAQVAAGFIDGEEFAARGLSDSDYVDVLYRTFFNREPDVDKAVWTGALADGWTRREVLKGFVNSAEFGALCESYGIIRGELN